MTTTNIPPCPVCGVVPKPWPWPDGTKTERLRCPTCWEFRFNERGWVEYCDQTLGRALRDLRIETVAQVRELYSLMPVLLDLAEDASSGLAYVRETHGDLYGVGFDRVKEKSYALPTIKLKIEAVRRRAAEGEG